MRVTINGKIHDLDDEANTIAHVVEQLGLADRRVAVELNERIVKRATYAEQQVTNGDIIEIVHFVGGG